MSTKRNLLFIVSIGMLLLAACSTARAAPPAQDGDASDRRTISVNGTGVVVLAPDMAKISIGVQTENASAAEAVAENSTKAQAVIEALSSFGIEPEDIQTIDFSVFPRQDRDPEGNLLEIQYTAQNTVQVTIRDLDQLGAVLDTVVQAGANTISGIQFDVADRSDANEKALGAAVQDARARAEVLASAAEVDLGPVVTINAFTSSPIVQFERAVAEFAAMDVPISAGQLQITVEVNAIFEITG